MREEVLAIAAWARLHVTYQGGSCRRFDMSGEHFTFGRTGDHGEP